ncbi:MAG TPA: alpha/beta fold hydrolase, partial [Nitrososphaerales archaeon]|nr:alpha/beta fold hydrolase [Nitrososphaerales archaeon]
MSVAETAKTLETLASVPFNYLVGSTKQRVIYVSNQGGTSTLWALDAPSGARSRLTEGPVASPDQVALPRHDSNSVVYLKDTAKGRELHLVYRVDAVDGGESPAVEMTPMRVEGLAMSGERVALTASTAEEAAVYLSESGRLEKKARLESFAQVTDMNDNFVVGAGFLAKNPRSSEIFILNISSGEFRQFTPRPGSVNKAPFLKGAQILFESDYAGRNQLYVHDMNTRQTAPAAFGHPDHIAYDATENQYYGWTEDGRIWSVGKKEGEAKAFLDGREVKTPRGFIWGFTLLDGKAYVAQTTVASPIRILEIEPEFGELKVVLDNPLPQGFGSKLAEGRFIRYESFDGREVPALVVDDGTGVPRRTVTYVHGGPWGEILNSWSVLLNSLVLSGYNVIAPNYRGSTGYGEEYRKLDIGDPGGGDLMDIASSAEWAQKNHLASEVAIVGYSYGGYSALLALGRMPELFSCGVAGAPIADWKQAYELSDAEYKHFIETLFDKKMELLPERSPATYV